MIYVRGISVAKNQYLIACNNFRLQKTRTVSLSYLTALKIQAIL